MTGHRQKNKNVVHSTRTVLASYLLIQNDIGDKEKYALQMNKTQISALKNSN